MKIPIGLPAVALATACAAPAGIPDTPRARQAVSEMSEMYQCAWYHYLDGNETRGNELIDNAAVIGRRAGIPGIEFLSVYGDAQGVQRARVEERAIEIAASRSGAIDNIMAGKPLVQPTEEETTQALLELYAKQCVDADDTP